MISTTGNKIDPHGVNHPSHYNMDSSGVECIEVVRHMNFNVGSAFKYVFRAGKKDLSNDRFISELNDLKKAVWYLDDELASGSKWIDRKILYRTKLKDIIASRTGNLKLVFEGFYYQDLLTARSFIMAEIERLKICSEKEAER